MSSLMQIIQLLNFLFIAEIDNDTFSSFDRFLVLQIEMKPYVVSLSTFLCENNIFANSTWSAITVIRTCLVIRSLARFLWCTVNLAAVASFLSDTPARERAVTTEITSIIGVIYHIGKCNFYLVPERDRKRPSIIPGTYPISYAHSK